MFNADRPIEKAEDDKLGRGKFANAIADSISNRREKENLVLGLCGPWGCGKTSIKNMILEKLESHVHVLEFNPWQRAKDCINKELFAELGRVFRLNDVASQSRRLADMWDYYSELTSYMPVLSPFSRIFKWAARTHNARAKYKEKALAEIKDEISKELLKIGKPILVVIDDIDRLFPDELQSLFKLIKANADFPNIIYLLVMDKSAVEAILKESLHERTEDFLDKIIQVELKVPYPNDNDIWNLFQSKLENIFNLYPTGLTENDIPFLRVNANVHNLFKTPRDLYRFCSSFAFSLSHYVKDGYCNINPWDLMHTEALKLFEPKVFDRILNEKYFLIKDYSYSSYPDSEENKKFESIIAVAKNRKAVENIMEALFLDSPDSINKEMEKYRIRDLNFFDSYFEMTLPENFLSNADEKYILKILEEKDISKNRDLVDEYLQRELLDTMVKRLKLISISDDQLIPLLAAIFDMGDEGSPVAKRDLEFAADDLFNPKIFLEVLKKSKGFYIPTRHIFVNNRLDAGHLIVARVRQLLASDEAWRVINNIQGTLFPRCKLDEDLKSLFKKNLHKENILSFLAQKIVFPKQSNKKILDLKIWDDLAVYFKNLVDLAEPTNEKEKEIKGLFYEAFEKLKASSDLFACEQADKE